MPKISVVCPVWNRQDCVQNAIASIINQTYKDWEIVVVDDGSTDLTERVVKSFEDARIRYYKIPHSGHISKVRNEGCKRAKGEWIVVQDSDDLSFPDRLEWIAKYFNEADVIYHDMYVSSYEEEYNAFIRTLRKCREYNHNDLLREQYIPGQIAYRKSLWEKHPYDERITVCDDWQLLIEFSFAKAKFKYIDRPLYEYVMRDDSANINGELDGRRFDDTRVIISILKEKYGVQAIGELRKWEPMTGKIVKQQYVK